MVWANYDLTKSPKIIVTFEDKILNDEDFYDFLKYWICIYEQKKDFTFVFDTTTIKQTPHIKYCIKMAIFIKNLKKLYKYHYLKQSTFIINNKLIKNMLEFIFFIQPPVAPIVYQVKIDN